MRYLNAPAAPLSKLPAATAVPAGMWLLRLPSQRSLLVKQRTISTNLLLSSALLAATMLSLCLGTVMLTPAEVVRALGGESQSVAVFIVQELRLPRLLAGALTGAAFALAGCLMQTLARNRLATPGIIGIDNGATAFAVASVLGTAIALAPPAMAMI